MSRAFVKEGDGEDALQALRVPSPEVNYVTPRGLEMLRDEVKTLTQLRDQHQGLENLSSQSVVREAERDLVYYLDRLRTAVLVEPAANPEGQVRFGSKVRAMDEAGEVYEVVLVGEDEADVQNGRISYVSPLARALLKARVGDEVLWKRPLGEVRLEIVSVDGVSD